jgi:hypothetical protein
MREWMRFFLFKLPLALLAVEAGTEAASFALQGVTLHRHNVDDLAYAVMRDPSPYRVVLLGDSVTHNVTHRFRIGGPGEVADLTTHFLAGPPSYLFLLKRYVESGHHPEHVVLAAAAATMVEPQSKATFNRYVTSVFQQPYEKNFLMAHYPTYVDYSWHPAALSVTTRIAEPLMSLLRSPGDRIFSASETAMPDPVAERYPDYAEDAALLTERLNAPAVVLPEVEAILGEMCELSRTHGFALHIVWAPLDAKLRGQLLAQGKLQAITARVQEIAREHKTVVTIDDSSDTQTYPYFNRDLVHIRGLGWEQIYANQLASYIRQFESAGETVAH